MKHPLYTIFAILCCAFLGLSNLRGWNYFHSSANRSALTNTSYRYRPAINTGTGSWFSGGGFHK